MTDDMRDRCGARAPFFLTNSTGKCPVCSSPSQERPDEIQNVELVSGSSAGNWRRLFWECGAEDRSLVNTPKAVAPSA